MVDAPNWGQDWQFVMRDNAASVFAADPQRNTIFSIHMYGVFDTAAEINDYLGRFQTAGLPIVVGEFGHNHSDGNPDEDTILATAQARGIGYLGWSWSGNGGGVEYLDMVTGFDVEPADQLGPAALQRRQRHQGHLPGGDRLRRHQPTTPPTTPPTAAAHHAPDHPADHAAHHAARRRPGCTATYTLGGQWGSGFQGDGQGDRRVRRDHRLDRDLDLAQRPALHQHLERHGHRLRRRGDRAEHAVQRLARRRRQHPWGFTASRGGTNTAPAVTCTAS